MTTKPTTGRRIPAIYIFLAGVVIGVVAMIATICTLLSAQAASYEAIIEELNVKHETEITQLNESHQEKVKALNEQITQLKDDIDRVKIEYESYKNNTEYEAKASFATLTKYWYVFRYASPDCGLTPGMIVYADELCQEKDINPDYVWSIIYMESRYNTDATTSLSSARGLGQLLKSTAKSIYENYMGNGSGTYDHSMAYDGYTNLNIMINYLEYLKINYGNPEVMINGYSGDQTSGYYNRLVQLMRDRGHNPGDITYSGQQS